MRRDFDVLTIEKAVQLLHVRPRRSKLVPGRCLFREDGFPVSWLVSTNSLSDNETPLDDTTLSRAIEVARIERSGR